MKKNKVTILIYLIIIFIILNIPVLAAEKIMPFNKVEAGMSGYGKTVFSGSKIERFDVEIVDVLKNQSLDQDMILIKMTDEKIKELGGIAAGMSGSPVYVEDRLIGAIGYGWNNSDHRYALLTPIERMLELLEKDNNLERNDDNISDFKIDLEDFPKENNFIKTKTPIMVSGMSGRALDRLEDNFSEFNMEVVPTSEIEAEDKSSKIPEPGESIAVQMVRGDINMASIGTLTYVDRGQFVAFGHSFTNRGKVNYLISRAHINAVIPSTEQPFKLGSPYSRLLGSVTQDRGAGIAGRLNTYPKITPLYISVSENGELLNEVNLQIVNDEYLFSSLANNSALEAIDSALDRIGPGSATSKVKIMGRGLPDLQIESSDMYYSQRDIGSMALSDFSQLLDLILTNPFKKINLIDVRLELNFDKNDSVALIQEAKVLNDQIYPGDEIEVKVSLHRYRDSTINKIVKMDIPESVEPGLATLFIDGGYTGETMRPEDTVQFQSVGGLNQAEISGHKSFESMLKDHLDSPNNNDLILQLYPSYSAPAYQESSVNSPQGKVEGEVKEGESEGNDDNDNERLKNAENEKNKSASNQAEEINAEIKQRKSTNYVLEGSLNLDLEISNPEAKGEAANHYEYEGDDSEKTQNRNN